ncbi:MAG TPA: CAP domain-containing protein [Anaerolineales bacterium]
MRKFLILLCISFILSLGFSNNIVAFADDDRLPAAYSAYDLISAVNALRASNGLSAYTANSILMGTAQAQANYMASSGSVTHYGANGSLPYQRALAAGYPVENALTNPPGFFSENIVGGPNLTPQKAVQEWQGDSLHMGTMLSPDLQDIGAGIAVVNGFSYYVIDCGLASGSKVSYTPSSGGIGSTGNIASSSQEPTIAMAIVSTPDQAGNIYHVVQPGQALWQIAIAYKVKINDIKNLNSLSSDVIFPGQKLLILRVGTPTPITPTAKPTIDLSTFTPLPTLAVITETATGTATPIPAAPAQSQNGTLVVGGIIFVALIASGFIAWGVRQRPI